ncbi:unnamed protein product, partial [Didymodactylos carnosus]
MPRSAVSPSEVAGSLNTVDEDGRQEVNSSLLRKEKKSAEVPRIKHGTSKHTGFLNYATHELKLENADIQELEVQTPSARPLAFWQTKTLVPRWVLVVLVNFFIVLVVTTIGVVLGFVNHKQGLEGPS